MPLAPGLPERHCGEGDFPILCFLRGRLENPYIAILIDYKYFWKVKGNSYEFKCDIIYAKSSSLTFKNII